MPGRTMDLPPLQFPQPITVARDARRQLLQGLAGGLVGGGSTLIILFLMKRSGRTLPPIHVWYFAVAVASWAISIVVHEAGHLLAGRLVGFRFLSLYLGPLRLSRESGSLRATWSAAYAMRGACVSVPVRWAGDASFRRSMIVFVAAGPLVNLALGAPALAGGIALRIFAIVSLLAGLLSLIPIRGGATDGTQLRRAIRFNERDRRESRVTVLASLAQTVAPPEWPAELVRNASDEASRDDVAAAAATLGYWSALHAGDLAGARTMLQRAIDTSTSARQSSGLALEAATFEGAWRRDAESARAWLGRASHTADDRHGRLVAEAAVSFAEDRRSEMVSLLDRAAATDAPAVSVILRRPTVEHLRGV
jgi:hypothetical protein